MKLPKITLGSTNNTEQPWVYYGFDTENGKGIEGGFSFQTGSNRWCGFIRSVKATNGYEYRDYYYIPNDGSTVNGLKFYIKTASDGKINAFLQINGSTDIVRVTATPFVNTDLSKMSVKRVTSIASTFAFDGTNIKSKSMNQK